MDTLYHSCDCNNFSQIDEEMRNNHPDESIDDYIKRSNASLKRVIDFERQLLGEDSLIRQTFGRSHLLPQEEMGFKDNEKLAAPN